MQSKDKELKAFEKLLNVMDELREKCPWDKKQTLNTLRSLTIEEVYELSDAIILKNTKQIEEELGDLFLHLIFYCKIGFENNTFTIDSVLYKVVKKLIYRHPHIYSNVKIDTDEEVKLNWEKLKLKEGKNSVLEGVPKSLPSINKSVRIQEKAKNIGFEWDNIDDVFNKVREELEEFHVEHLSQKSNKNRVKEEFGDILFSLINYARYIGIDPDEALEHTNLKFISRFQFIENYAKKNFLNIENMSLQEMDKLWDLAKTKGC